MHIKYIDNLKAVLIICVVLGHAPFSNDVLLHKYIFWFHMPVFFMLNGYLTGWEKGSLKEFCCKKIRAYVIPYISFSLIFIIFSSNILKNLIRMILGGNLNITYFSYPFWFINTLILSVCIYRFILEYCSLKWQVLIGIILWVMVHIYANMNFRISIPWGVEYSFLAIPYLMIGKMLRKIKIFEKNLSHYLGVGAGIIIFIIIIIEQYTNLNYEYDMKSLLLNNYFLDLIIPILFFIFLCEVSKFFSKIKIVNWIFCYIGKASIVIYFLHAGILHLTHLCFQKELNFQMGNMEPLFCVIISIFIGTFIYYIFNCHKLTRICFLGKNVM